LSDSATAWNEQIAIAQTMARGPMEFSIQEKERCNSVISRLESALGGATTNQLQQGHRAIGALLLRLEQPAEALAALEKSLSYRPAQIDRAATFYLETICLVRLNRAVDAGVAFQKAEALQKKLFVDPLGDSENFLGEAECNCLVLRREAQALLAGV
jgi:tetratricopeptide (TPR) repeat protein